MRKEEQTINALQETIDRIKSGELEVCSLNIGHNQGEVEITSSADTYPRFQPVGPRSTTINLKVVHMRKEEHEKQRSLRIAEEVTEQVKLGNLVANKYAGNTNTFVFSPADKEEPEAHMWRDNDIHYAKLYAEYDRGYIVSVEHRAVTCTEYSKEDLRYMLELIDKAEEEDCG